MKRKSTSGMEGYGLVQFGWNYQIYDRSCLSLTKGKEWADVESMQWETNGDAAKNSLQIEEFCKYKYIIYTEVSNISVNNTRESLINM